MEGKAVYDSEKVNMTVTLILWTVLCTVCMALMLYVAAHKTVVIADEVPGRLALSVAGGQGASAQGAEEPGAGEAGVQALVFAAGEGAPGSIRIPLAQDVRAEDVTVENRYLDRELWVYLEGADASYYREKAILGDIASVAEGRCEEYHGGVILKIRMERVWEYYSTLEYDPSSADSGNFAVISFRDPHQVYRQVVVIDPAGGGSDRGSLYRGYAEKTLALQVAQSVPEKPGTEDIRLYFTRLEDVDVSDQERIDLAEDVDADLYIRIAAGEDADPGVYGVAGSYNEEYYIPGTGNVQLADALTRNVTVASCNRALGISPAPEDSILRQLTLPAAQIDVGFLTNEKEASLLGQASYRDRLAQGIADAILEIYKQNEAEREAED